MWRKTPINQQKADIQANRQIKNQTTHTSIPVAYKQYTFYYSENNVTNCVKTLYEFNKDNK